jgi:AmmeMemoRadiSam system protein A
VTAVVLSPAARRALLTWARASLAAHLDGRPCQAAEHDEELRRPGGAFVTLRRRKDHELRGCVGLIETQESLAAVVAEAAVAAATRDGRFDFVTAAELPDLCIEISVLGPVSAICSDDVEVGLHGLIVQFAGRRGLLLPQVPVDRGWDRETFLGWTCRKAGLPADTWRKPGCELLGFTALVFGEEDATSAGSPAPARA